jgi:processing peptidase subunit alpha
LALAFSAGGALSPKEKSTARVLEHLLTRRLGGVNTGFVASYSDAALIGLSGVTRPTESRSLVDLFLKEFQTVATSAASDIELEAAKKASGLGYITWNQTKNGALTQLARMAYRQTTVTETSIVAGLNAVTSRDVQSLAEKLLASKPTLASVGDVSEVPRYEDLLKKLT